MLLLFCFSQGVSYLVLTIPMFKIVGRELQLWKEKKEVKHVRAQCEAQAAPKVES